MCDLWFCFPLDRTKYPLDKNNADDWQQYADFTRYDFVKFECNCCKCGKISGLLCFCPLSTFLSNCCYPEFGKIIQDKVKRNEYLKEKKTEFETRKNDASLMCRCCLNCGYFSEVISSIIWLIIFFPLECIFNCFVPCYCGNNCLQDTCCIKVWEDCGLGWVVGRPCCT